MMRHFTVVCLLALGVVVSVLLSAGSVDARKYGIKSISTDAKEDCDVAFTKHYGDDEDGVMLVDHAGNLVTSQGEANFQVQRTLPRYENGSIRAVTMWSQKVRFIVSAATGIYALGRNRTVISEVVHHLGLYQFTHLVPITTAGVDPLRESIALSQAIPIYIQQMPIAMVFQGRDAVGLFIWSNEPLRREARQWTTAGHDGIFYLIDLITGGVTVVEEYVMSTDHCSVSYDLAAYGVLEEDGAEFNVLCMGHDGLSRFNHNGGRMGYVWGPTPTLIDMHEVTVDYYRPEEQSWYVGIDNHGANDVWMASLAGNYIARCGGAEYYSSASALFNPVAALYHTLLALLLN